MCVTDGSRHSRMFTPVSKPANKSMKRKIILLLSHEEKRNEKEKSFNFTVQH